MRTLHSKTLNHPFPQNSLVWVRLLCQGCLLSSRSWSKGLKVRCLPLCSLLLQSLLSSPLQLGKQCKGTSHLSFHSASEGIPLEWKDEVLFRRGYRICSSNQPCHRSSSNAILLLLRLREHSRHNRIWTRPMLSVVCLDYRTWRRSVKWYQWLSFS